jgi:biopolymer transport protein ExbD
MSLRSRNKVQTEFNMSSMTDLVFLLLIFFMILSTLITNNNVMDITLPQSASNTRPQDNFSVISLSEDLVYALDGEALPKEQLLPALQAKLGAPGPEVKVQLAVDENVAHKYFVELADIVWVQGQYRITLMTAPKNQR